MEKIRINLPEDFMFETGITLRVTDINYGGHLGNDAVMGIVHESRIRFLKNYNFTELDIDGFGIIQANAVIIYKSEAFHGDKLTIKVTVGDFSATRCNFYYQLLNAETGKEVARALTGISFFDYTKRKVVKMPQKFRNIKIS